MLACDFVRRPVRLRLAGLSFTLVAAALEAQVAPRPRPASPPVPAPGPAPVAVPAAPALPLAPRAPLAALDALGPLVVDAIGDAFSTTEVASIVAEGVRLGMEGAAMARRAAPFAWEGDAWEGGAVRLRGYRTMAPEPWDAQDPADSLYRDARRALSSDAYQRAAELFRQIRQKYPRSSYAADAPYWEAFALQRLGGESNLRLAQDVLGLQQREYPRAATRGDAAALNARIEGMLGRRGDVFAAQALRGRAERAASDSCPAAEEDERVAALNAVAQMDAERAMPILQRVLARRELCTQQLRRTAVWLVARQKSPEAASLLMSAARTDPDREVREQAVFWLANVPTDEAVTMLVELARNGDDLDLRKRAVYALSRSRSEKALATLREVASDTKTPDELRMEAFGWYLRAAQPSTADRLPFLKTMYASASTDGMKQTVLRSVASVRGEEARAFLVGLALNERESFDVRRSAVLFLERLGGLAAVTRLPNGRDSVPTTSATRAGEFTAIVRALWQVYEKTEELELRRQVLSSLSRVGDNAGTDKLIEVARTEKNPELRRVAISALSRSKDPRAIELLQEIINK